MDDVDATLGRERPILFSGAMVNAILAGRKTVTRRIAKLRVVGATTTIKVLRGPHAGSYANLTDEMGIAWSPAGGDPPEPYPHPEHCCPHGRAGDRLVVLEGHALTIEPGYDARNGNVRVRYLVDGTERVIGVSHATVDSLRDKVTVVKGRGRPGRFMPRWASRITLAITDVRVERLTAISDDEIVAEGVDVTAVRSLLGQDVIEDTPLRDLWRMGWDALNGKTAPFASDPFVWVVSFTRVAQNGSLS